MISFSVWIPISILFLLKWVFKALAFVYKNKIKSITIWIILVLTTGKWLLCLNFIYWTNFLVFWTKALKGLKVHQQILSIKESLLFNIKVKKYLHVDPHHQDEDFFVKFSQQVKMYLFVSIY